MHICTLGIYVYVFEYLHEDNYLLWDRFFLASAIEY